MERAVEAAEKHLELSGDLIGVPEREVVRRHAAGLVLLGPLPVGYVHGDFQERNWLHDSGSGSLAVVDLERARPHAAVLDVVRLACGPWVRRPELRTAFFEGFGRELTSAERTALRCLSALDAVGAIAWGVPHEDKELVDRGRETLARLVRGITDDGRAGGDRPAGPPGTSGAPGSRRGRPVHSEGAPLRAARSRGHGAVVAAGRRSATTPPHDGPTGAGRPRAAPAIGVVRSAVAAVPHR
ncbi:hypothetical protein E4K10_32070 [Streptomyces sp. T1317-0309]|nr:hypothetical protein E4K10_32070 [Streptomyces sp. T1317-0309]